MRLAIGMPPSGHSNRRGPLGLAVDMLRPLDETKKRGKVASVSLLRRLARDGPVGKRPNSICTGLKNTTTQTQSEMLKQRRRSTPPTKQRELLYFSRLKYINHLRRRPGPLDLHPRVRSVLCCFSVAGNKTGPQMNHQSSYRARQTLTGARSDTRYIK